MIYNLKDLRDARGWSLDETASRLKEFGAEVTRGAVGHWETGTARPSLDNLFALAKLFGVDPLELKEAIDSQGPRGRKGDRRG